MISASATMNQAAAVIHSDCIVLAVDLISFRVHAAMADEEGMSRLGSYSS
jgi:hypothetical protein